MGKEYVALSGKRIVVTPKKKDPTAIIAILVVLLSLGIYGYFIPEKENSQAISEPRGFDEIAAGGACKEFVRERLKNPRTAEFETSIVRQTSGNTGIVTGLVYAENSFGATIRTYYQCEVMYDTGDWYLKSIRIE